MDGGEAGFHKAPDAEKAHTRQKSGLNNGKLVSPDQPHQPPIRCPECTSQRVWKDGIRYLNDGRAVQRYLCRSCGFRFSETAKFKVKFNVASKVAEISHPPSNLTDQGVSDTDFPFEKSANGFPFSSCKDIASHEPSKITTAEKDLNMFPLYNSNRRVCVSEGEMKNLAEVETRQKRAAGATTKLTDADVKGKLVEYAWWMKKQGYPESTITPRIELLELMAKRGANLWDPESVKETIARQETWGNGRKANAVYAYSTFAVMEGLTWDPPRYKREQGIPFVPLESELDQFIAASGKVMGTFLQGLKETAADPGEFIRVEWTDINPQARSISLNHPVKGHNPRIITGVSTELIARLNTLPKRERPFPCLVDSTYRNFYKQRRRIARQLGNPRLLKITFTTLRHWKATMEYHRTKDILWVMKLLGHRSLRNTLIYIDLERAIYGTPGNEEFTVRVATTLDEACELLEAGFDYVTDVDGRKLFRKRK